MKISNSITKTSKNKFNTSNTLQQLQVHIRYSSTQKYVLEWVATKFLNKYVVRSRAVIQHVHASYSRQFSCYSLTKNCLY